MFSRKTSRKEDMRKCELIILLMILMMRTAIPQNAPVTTAPYVAYSGAGQVGVPVAVVNFTNIGAVSLTLDYDYSVVHFVNGVTNPLLGYMSIIDNDLGTGMHRITMGWFGQPKSLPPGVTLVTLNFTYISGSTALTWYDNGTSCEYADGSYNVLNDLPASTYYINGMICGQLLSPGIISGPTSVCANQSMLVYSVNPVQNATSYTWTVPAGASVVTGAGTNSVMVSFGTASGNVTVQPSNSCGTGPASSMVVSVSPVPAADAGPDQSIPYGSQATLSGNGGIPGSFSYHWKPESLLVNPYVQNPQTVSLTNTTVFTLVVSQSQTSCSDSDQVVISVFGGPLSVAPFAYPDQICKNSTSQLFANPGGGSGNYTFAWTCNPPGIPPWTSTLPNPVVSPGETTSYQVTVSDGFTYQNGYVNVQVSPLPEGVMSGGDTLCGETDSASLRIDLTGNPPWDFSFTNGTITRVLNGVMSTPFFERVSEPGTWQISSLNDQFCEGVFSGEAFVMHYPIPPDPVITQSGNTLVSGSCCGNQWYVNGNLLPGETGQICTPSVTGNYSVIVTVNSCPSAQSNSIYIIVTGNGHLSYNEMRVFPNPFTDYLMIERPQANAETAGIYSAEGRLIREIRLTGNKFRLVVQDLPPGFYVLKTLTRSFCVIKT